jgi:hypothetical protein
MTRTSTAGEARRVYGLSGGVARSLEALARRRNESLQATIGRVLELVITAREEQLPTPEQQPDVELATRQFVWDLNDRLMGKLLSLARLRGEPPERTLRYIVRSAALRTIPATIKWFDYIPDLEIESAETVKNNLARIALPNGRVFTSYASNNRYRRLYYLLANKVSQRLDAETYEIAVDAYRRYLRGVVRWTSCRPRAAGGS